MPRPFPWAGRLLLAAAFACLALPASPLRACSVCGCGDPLLAAGSSLPMAGQVRLALDAEYLYTTAAGDAPGSTEHLAQETLRPVLVYSPGAALSLVLQAPVLRKDWWTDDPASQPQATANTGLGDIDLGARWFFWQAVDLPARRSRTLALSLGSSMPTGDSELTVGGTLIDQHAQLGTGAWGPYAGLLYGYNAAAWGASVNAAYRYRGTNWQGYQFGQALTFGAGGHWRVLEGLALTLSLDGRYAGYDQDWSAGQANPDTGGTVLDLTPGFGWQLSDGLGLNGRVQVPVYTALFGTQLVTPTVDLSLQYLFQL
jgi:hypothetical protein